MHTTPEQQKEFLLNFFETRISVNFKELISTMDEKMIVICTFVSILQLALEGYLGIIYDGKDLTEFSLIKLINEQLN
jgi:chromatin segregation and condensation protein Rec8/ScpA/Scc1 (kleisin family)